MKAPVLIIDRADIAVAPPSLAENTAVLTYLTNLINTVYAKDEGEFWKEGLFSRCRPDDVHDFVLAGQLAIAWRQGSSQTDTADLMGCVRVQMLDHRTGEFGVLVCDPIFRGAGVGRDLLGFAEGWAKSQGAEVMQLEVLSPDGWEHASKARLMGWYERVGYVLVRVGEVAYELPPWLTSILVQPAKVRVYEKPL